jgi:hypothetical protein
MWVSMSILNGKIDVNCDVDFNVKCDIDFDVNFDVNFNADLYDVFCYVETNENIDDNPLSFFM